jgi:hypothetical protein
MNHFLELRVQTLESLGSLDFWTFGNSCTLFVVYFKTLSVSQTVWYRVVGH